MNAVPEALHYHDEYELRLIVSNHGQSFVGDHIGHFSPGSLTLIGPGLPHSWVALGEASRAYAACLVLHFSADAISKGIEAFPELSEVAPLLARSRHGVEFVGMSGDIGVRMTRIKASGGLSRLSDFVALLEKLTRCIDYRLLSRMPMRCSNDRKSMTRIDGVLEFLKSNFAEDISYGDLCADVGMSPSVFSRYFRSATGRTFSGFLGELRIAQACCLLERTEQSITTICYAVGFRNMANFNRRFLKLKSVTPGQYRRTAADHLIKATGLMLGQRECR